MVDNLKQKVKKGIFWSIFDKGGTQVIQFVINIAMARILLPEDYGLVGLLAVFILISVSITSSGFPQALIQRGKDVSQIEYNSVFAFNIFISLLCYGILYIGSPLIANYFNDPRLILLTKALSLNIVFLALGIIPNTILSKKLNFKTIAKINLTGIASSSVLGLIFALAGYGVWALVIMALAESFIKTSLFWIFNNWRPTNVYSFKPLKSLFAYGSKLLVGGLIADLSNSIYSLVIGKSYTISDVGYFNQAKKLQERVGYTVSGSIVQTLFPSYALIKDDIERFRNAIRTHVKVTSLIVFPMLFGLGIIAREFVILVLTEKWEPSIVFIQILCIGGIFFILNDINIHAIFITGKINFYLKLTIISNLLLLIIIAICLIFKVSLLLLIIGKVIWLFINFSMFYFHFKKIFNFKIIEYLEDLFYPLLFSSIMAISVFQIGKLFTSICWTQLITQITSGILIYALLNFVFNKRFILQQIRKQQ